MNSVKISSVCPDSLEVVTTITCPIESAKVFFDSDLFEKREYKDIYPHIRSISKKDLNKTDVLVIVTSCIVASTEIQILADLGSIQEQAINSLINLSKEISILNRCAILSKNAFKITENIGTSIDDELEHF